MTQLNEVINLSEEIAKNTDLLIQKVATLEFSGGIDPFIFGLTAFILACFVGYFVVWKVTPALHTPLMSVTNAVSGVIIVGAIIALGSSQTSAGVGFISFMAVLLASVNIFGGFVVTWRMLSMFKKKPTASK